MMKKSLITGIFWLTPRLLCRWNVARSLQNVACAPAYSSLTLHYF